MSEAVHLFIIATLATAVLSCFGFSWRLYGIMVKRHEEELGHCRTYIAREIQRIEQNFYEYKLHVANGFATLQHLRESEQRTQDSLSNISQKLDRLIEGRMK